MKKIFLRLLLPVIFVTYVSSATAQDVDQDVLNWYNTKLGMSTDKAYKKLKKITPDTVIVAIIDAGIDIDHEDLQGHIWTNKNEIPGNGIDDDENGYIDDVHGWNFLGNTNGENQEHARLNVTRIYAQLRPKYDGVDSAEVTDEDREEYNLYLETKENVESSQKEYEGYIDQIKQFKDNMLPMIPGMVANMMGIEEDDLNEDDLKKWKAEGAQQEQMKKLALSILSGKLTEKVLDEQIKGVQSRIDYHYNPDFNGRKVVGDDPYDMDDRDYGNNDVAGPDPLHGTHVGGIVSAIRGNGLGGDGVANNVLLMSVRAVPDGDEFDKDVSLAIRYAVDNGAKVINGSFGKDYSSLPRAVYDAIMYAQDHDVLFVQAAGNDGKDLAKNQSYPSVMYNFQKEPFTHMITVGASTRVHKKKLAAPFSNYGADQVDIFAPGAEIYNSVPDNKYRSLQGTSMASPMVAGVAALLKGYFPSLTMGEVRDIILESGDDFGDTDQILPGSDEVVKFSTMSITGKVVDVKSAVKMAMKMEKAKKKEAK